MIAYCGIYCEECPSCKGTITGDKSLLEKMSEDFGNVKNRHHRLRLSGL